MATIDERQRVAAALRAKYRERTEGRFFLPQMIGAYEIDYLRDLESCLPDGESMFTVLADLIDPGYDASATLTDTHRHVTDASATRGTSQSVDREALLALAGKMERNADDFDATVGDVPMVHAGYLTACAERIREALGEEVA